MSYRRIYADIFMIVVPFPIIDGVKIPTVIMGQAIHMKLISCASEELFPVITIRFQLYFCSRQYRLKLIYCMYRVSQTLITKRNKIIRELYIFVFSILLYLSFRYKENIILMLVNMWVKKSKWDLCHILLRR